jgi:FkbM family methyltransferase
LTSAPPIDYQPTIVPLDYANRRILMEHNSDAENFRIMACQKEPWTISFIESIPQDGVFYDVGANTGPYAMVAATGGVQTVAIEPSFSNYSALCSNALRNKVLPHIIALPVALANRTGLIWLDYNDIRAGGASHVFGSPTPAFFSTHRQKVMTYALDELIPAFSLPAPTHIKIDVDGNGKVEMAVLGGMVQTLASPQLVGLMLEIPLDAEEAIVKGLKERGWEMAERFDHRGEAQIQGICYGRFERVAVEATAEEMAVTDFRPIEAVA